MMDLITDVDNSLYIIHYHKIPSDYPELWKDFTKEEFEEYLIKDIMDRFEYISTIQ